MPNITGLYTALSGMNAHRRVLDVTAHNIANQATPGYHRQRAELQAIGVGDVAGVFAGPNPHVGGVEVVGVSRIVDQLAENRVIRETALHGGTSTMRANLDRIEQIFPEPSEHGIAAKLDDFFAGWSDLSTQPDEPAVRLQLLDRAQGLIDAFGRASADLQSVVDSSKVHVGNLATEANDLATRIAKLNETIVGSRAAPNDLIDQRDQLVKELASLTGAVPRTTTGGAVDVTIGGRAIVSGPRANLLDGSTGALLWAVDGSTVAAPPSRLAALTDTIENVVPGYRQHLDDIASSVVSLVNSLHTTGYDPAGGTGRTFFDPAGTTAATMSLSVDVAGQPMNIAAGAPVLPGPVAPGPLDGDLARQLADLADADPGPVTEYQSLVSGLGTAARGARQDDVIQGQLTLAAVNDAESVGGVSLDEEMATLVATQRAYEASARVLNTVDELLGVLLRTGLAGR